MKSKRGLGVIAGAVLLALFAIIPGVAAGQFTVVVGGLQNPRGLAFGPGGRLYVAQAGAGGGTATGKFQRNRTSSIPTRASSLFPAIQPYWTCRPRQSPSW